MSEFFEAIWHGEGIGDGADLEEALQAYAVVNRRTATGWRLVLLTGLIR